MQAWGLHSVYAFPLPLAMLEVTNARVRQLHGALISTLGALTHRVRPGAGYKADLLLISCHHPEAHQCLLVTQVLCPLRDRFFIKSPMNTFK